MLEHQKNNWNNWNNWNACINNSPKRQYINKIRHLHDYSNYDERTIKGQKEHKFMLSQA